MLNSHHFLKSVDEFLTENPKLNLSTFTKQLLDCDLKNIGGKYLPDSPVTGKNETLEANCVLQLVKLRNIGAPKENEHSHSSPPMYKLTLTDGLTNINCLALENIPNLSLNTPPGTKIHLTGILKIKSNLVILFAKNVKILGGNVDYLVNKWKLTKDLSHHIRKMCLTDTAPPPWVPFGTRQKTQVDTSKKVFEETNPKDDQQTNEFSEARKAVVAEALETKAKTIKTFAQQNIDKSKIIAESITNASNQPSTTSTAPRQKEQKKGKKGKFRDIDNEEDYSDVKNTARPPAASTLFDAFKTKLNIQDEEKPIPQPEPTFEPRGRGQRGQRFQRGRNQPQQQQQSKTDTNKQVYNPNDFAFELGDDPTKSTKQKEVDYYYNPADFEDKKELKKETKTEFKNSFEANKPLAKNEPNQNQNQNNINAKNEININPSNSQRGNYNNRNNQNNDNRDNRNYNQDRNIPSMTFSRSQNNPRPQQQQFNQGYNNNYRNNNYQNQYYDDRQNYQSNNYQPNYNQNNYRDGNYYQDDYYYDDDQYSNNQYYDQSGPRYQRGNMNQNRGSNFDRNQNYSNRRNY
ncbi:unnamed protein product [Brachionus calyciflorus]|uniref:RecQ mediated genome instability protein 1 OB-fold domain-containing protein n=1 Tax=Brachionus calyciflorus TaxID=104777 RepID=A0A813N4J4_9BILA|nr:unnamed protein product [Brachionus calyciflorus]